MENRLFLAIICILITTGVCCTPGPSQQNLERALRMNQNDIPVPLGYRFNADDSKIKQFSSFRLCELIYKSGPDPAHGPRALKEFYGQFMPAYNWKQLEWKGHGNSMLFQKNTKTNEFCRIDIYRSRSITTLYILVGNKALVTAD
jgi:hypothetical protein